RGAAALFADSRDRRERAGGDLSVPRLEPPRGAPEPLRSERGLPRPRAPRAARRRYRRWRAGLQRGAAAAAAALSPPAVPGCGSAHRRRGRDRRRAGQRAERAGASRRGDDSVSPPMAPTRPPAPRSRRPSAATQRFHASVLAELNAAGCEFLVGGGGAGGARARRVRSGERTVL